jgi:hypothetical protein
MNFRAVLDSGVSKAVYGMTRPLATPIHDYLQFRAVHSVAGAPPRLAADARAAIVAEAGAHLDADRPILVFSGLGATKETNAVDFGSIAGVLKDSGSQNVHTFALAKGGTAGMTASAEGMAAIIRQQYAANGNRPVDVVLHCKAGIALLVAQKLHPDLTPMVRRAVGIAVPVNGITSVPLAEHLPGMHSRAAPEIRTAVNAAMDGVLAPSMRDMRPGSKPMELLGEHAQPPTEWKWLSISSTDDPYVNPAAAHVDETDHSTNLVVDGKDGNSADHSAIVRTNPHSLEGLARFFAD